MPTILEDIYYGKVRLSARAFVPGSKYGVLVDQAARLEDEINSKLPEDIRSLFRQYAAACSEINDISSLEDFKSGTRFAVRFMLAALDNEQGCYDRNHDTE